MKIGIVTEKLDDAHTSGHGRYILELVRNLQKLENDEFCMKLIHFQKFDLDIYNDTNQIVLHSHLKYNRNLFPLYLRKFGLDLIHYPSQNVPLTFWMANRSTIITLHGIDFAFDRYDRKRKRNAQYFRTFPKTAKMIITPTESASRCVKSFFRFPDVRTIHHGYDQIVFNSNYNKDDICDAVRKKYDVNNCFLLHVSTLKSYKNFDAVLRAYHGLYLEKYDVDLVIAGARNYEKKLYLEGIKKLIPPAHCDKHIHFLPYISDKDLAILYSLAEVLVNPSLESFGFPLVEAMACGCPVIYGNGYGASDVVSDAGIAVPLLGRQDNEYFNWLVGGIERNEINVKTVADVIQSAIMKILDDEKLHEQLRKKSLDRAKHFSWMKCAHEHVQAYRSVIE